MAELTRVDGDDDGLKIILTPAQLAAVLEDETLEPGGTLSNRLIGALRIVGCGFEVVGGGLLLAAPEPTTLTKIGGGVLVAHGADQCVTGGRQVWTGRDARSLTERGVSSAALALGATPRQAQAAGVIADIGVPIGAATLAGAARAVSVQSGRVSLARHEATSTARGAAGGHTIARHVGRTEAELRTRLAQMAARGQTPQAVSSFTDLRMAERAVSLAVRSNKTAIEAWARAGGSGGNFVRTVPAGRTVGHGVVASTGQYVGMTNVRIVLKFRTYNNMRYYILTAYPSL